MGRNAGAAGIRLRGLAPLPRASFEIEERLGHGCARVRAHVALQADKQMFLAHQATERVSVDDLVSLANAYTRLFDPT